MRELEVRLLGERPRFLPLLRRPDGYFEARVADCPPGTRYQYRLDGERERPDPASHLQPEGVHGPSEVVDPHFAWTDAGWRGCERADLVFYQLHVGTFTAAGTFDGALAELPRLRGLGVTALQLLPVAQFPGSRNWGYDGVYPFAVQHSYGGPAGLKRLVDAAHGHGLAVFLDAVFNHLGPEGCYLAEFGPYENARVRTPWGPALNFDGRGSDDVRRFFLESALRWRDEFHVDGLRLDAVHAIVDQTARPFLAELAEALGETGPRPFHLVAESALNDPRVVTPAAAGGLGLHAQWNDDFQRALFGVLIADHVAHYQDFGRPDQLAKAYREGYVLTGEYSAYRGRRHGRSSAAVPADRLVVFAQNHDQVANRRGSQRLAALVPPQAVRLAAVAVLLAPALPLLFMGEEYGETRPFPYFTSFEDAALGEAVWKGRRATLAETGWGGEVPDPQAEGTFESARLDTRPAAASPLHAFYAELLRLRREHPALRHPTKDGLAVEHAGSALVVRRRHAGEEVLLALNFGAESTPIPVPEGRWSVLLDSLRWPEGDGARPLPRELLPAQAVVLRRE